MVLLFTRAEDVPGQWLGHCLDIDVMSQGDSFEHAMTMLLEAVRLTVKSDLERGVDPLARSQAPDECWELAQSILTEGTSVEQLEESDLHAATGHMLLSVPTAALPQLRQEPAIVLPPAWQIAGLSQLRHAQTSC
jgi:predicted RNase H-like HicB family nuclease